MHDQSDNMTQTRGSIQEKVSFWNNFKSLVCPCLAAKNQNAQSKVNYTENTVAYKNQVNAPFGYKFGKNQEDSFNKKLSYRRNSVELRYDSRIQGLLDKKGKKSITGQRQTLQIQLNNHFEIVTHQEYTSSISNYSENQLLSIGINESHLLVKIQKVQIHPNPVSLKKDLTKSPKRKKEKDSSFNTPQFEKFWNQRYIIFERFDEGVKLDQGAWSQTPPQQISQFIASKCSGAKVIINGFAGVGGTAIKLANVSSCVKIIANDFNGNKLSLLLHNANVYQVQCNIELSEQDFLVVDKRNIDVVFVHPPFKNDAHEKCISIVDFEPTLNKVITKCLKLAPDLMMLLPPQISIEALCSCINKCASQLKKMKGSCSVKVDKIYFQKQFKYILVSFGGIIQKEIKLNDELDYIYGRLKRKGETLFKYKKIIKKIRQQYGMLQLLNILKISQKKAKQKEQKSQILGKTEDIIESFFEIVREKQLIPTERLEKLIDQQSSGIKSRASLKTQSVQKSKQKQQQIEAVMEQQKAQENNINFRQSEQTQSDYSHYSYLSGLDKTNNSHLSRLMRGESDSFSSVIIKRTLNGSRQKRDLSPNNSPTTPKRVGKNRISHVGEQSKRRDL